MEIESPYLQAIQAIAGKTPGEKQKTINSIARAIANAEKSSAQIPDVPEPLRPLVRVEVAKILHQYEGIIESLKSEDITIVSRALQAKWFFEGSDTNVINAQPFLTSLLPEISLYARFKIVKNFGVYLRNTALAAEFFLTIVKLYGVGEAIPLLLACDEDFAFRLIIENKIVLSIGMVETLFRKYPNLVVKYLMLSKPNDDDNVRNDFEINIRDYVAFLPQMANTRFEDFMEIYRMHGRLNVKLGKGAANTFIKTQLMLLVEEPAVYLELVPLKMVTQKLSTRDFGKMIKNLFPAKMSDFCYWQLDFYLQYYRPRSEKILLILNTFREVYGKDLLSCKNLIDSTIIKMLPLDDRVRQARLKLEEDKTWHIFDEESSWRCYLPTNESIPAITQEIARTSDATKRGGLLDQLIYTCKVNDDKDALLKVLNYIYDRHKNDQRQIFYGCFRNIYNSFDLAMLSSSHWEILNKYIKFTKMQGDLCNEADKVTPLIEAALHHCLLNDLPMDDYVRMFVDIKIQTPSTTWNIFKNYPDLEKKFLDLFIDVIPKQYPPDNEIWNHEARIITSLASSLWNFNERNKVPNAKMKKLSVRDYPWLFGKMKPCILDYIDTSDYTGTKFVVRLQKNDRDSYFALLPDLDRFWTFNVSVISDILKKQPQRVVDQWKECLSAVDCDHSSLVFLTKSRWYQELPIKFVEESMKTYIDPEKCEGAVLTLALLTEGEVYAKIIEPFIPKEEKMDVDHPEANDTYKIVRAIMKYMQKVNPPVSLNIIEKFCVGDYLQMVIRSVGTVCLHVPVTKVIAFARTLMPKAISVMKHGIRLTYLVGTLEEIYTLLTDLWNSKGHTSIRLVVFSKIYDFFRKQPDSRSWLLMRTCIDNLNTNDDEAIFRRLSELSTVPNEYLHEYIKTVLTALKSMEQKAEDSNLYVEIACRVIKNIDGPVTHILPDDYCQDLIKEYLFNFNYNSDIFDAGKSLTIDSYLLSSGRYNKSRFKFFGEYFRYTVKEYWNKPDPKKFEFYPFNAMVRQFFQTVCDKFDSKLEVRIFESFLEIFQSALEPCQDAVSYVDLVYRILYHKSQTPVDFGIKIAQKIPELVEYFSPDCVVSISDRLVNFLNSHAFCESGDNDEKILAIMEALVNSKDIHCAVNAARMIFHNRSEKLNERYKIVVNALRDLNHPGVSWYLNERLVSFGSS